MTLRDVNATGANLTGATLSDVSMTDAVLDRALRRADLPADRVLPDENILIGIAATGPVEEVTSRAMAALRPFVR